MRNCRGSSAVDLRWIIADLRVQVKLIRLGLRVNAFNPDQPRVPAGDPDGGQWSEGEHSSDNDDDDYQSLIHLASEITGFTKHGINQAINREISPSAILDAVKNPIKIRPQGNGTTQYRGKDATVVLNPAGEVVTIWPQ